MKTNRIVSNHSWLILFLACLIILAICFAYVIVPLITETSLTLVDKVEKENAYSTGIKKTELERIEQIKKIGHDDTIKKARFNILKKLTIYSNLYTKMIGRPAPNFSLNNFVFHNLILGNTFDDLKSLQGNVVIINFWATSHGTCLSDISHLNELNDKFKGQPVYFISITEEDKIRVMSFLKKNPLKTCIGFDTTRSIFDKYGVDTIPHTVLVDKEGIVVAITYPWKVSEQVINNILLGEKLNIRGFPKVKYGDVSSKLKLMELDEKHLLFKAIEKSNIKRILLFVTDKPTLTEKMREDFEPHVFHQLRWIIEGDFESYVWLEKRKNPDYKGDFSREAAKFEYDAIFLKPQGTSVVKVVSGNTTFVSSVVREPPHIMQFGFVNIWLDMIQTTYTGKNPVDINPDWQELRNRVGSDGIVAKVSMIAKTSAGDYYLITIIFYYDENLSIFRTFKSIIFGINNPLEDIPWNDMSSLPFY